MKLDAVAVLTGPSLPVPVYALRGGSEPSTVVHGVGVCRAHPASRSSRVRSDAASLSARALARSAGLLAVLAELVPQGKSTPAAMAADISPGGLR